MKKRPRDLTEWPVTAKLLGKLTVVVSNSGLAGAHHSIDQVIDELRFKAHEAVDQPRDVRPGDSIIINIDIKMEREWPQP